LNDEDQTLEKSACMVGITKYFVKVIMRAAARNAKDAVF